jgi:2-polyprenyl-6-methoxyphenol hydroxylase-like FAD-dependent oxidoreductase
VIVFGAGPVGLTAALQASKRFRTTLITTRVANVADDPRIEAVPAQTIALFIELGIHPHRIGVRQLHETRLVAWDSAIPVPVRSGTAAYVERPALELALLERVAASRIRLLLAEDKLAIRAALRSSLQRRLRIIDATGRAAVSAAQRIRPRYSWIARMFILPSHRSIAPELRIAALPHGFAYRMASTNYAVVGIVGNSTELGNAQGDPEHYLRGQNAGWMLEGISDLNERIAEKNAPASVQWTTGAALRVGDAALARDTLSSQGLACGISEALAASTIGDAEEESRFCEKQQLERLSHLRNVSRLIDACRFKDSEAWARYREFICDNHQA